MRLQFKKILLMCVLLLHAPVITAVQNNQVVFNEPLEEEQKNFFQRHKTAIIASTATTVVIIGSVGFYLYKQGYVDSLPTIFLINKYSQKLQKLRLNAKEFWTKLNHKDTQSMSEVVLGDHYLFTK